ncbi:MAG: transposase [Thermomicrobiales bacterium]
MPTLPPAMLHLLTPFAPLFARRVWTRALVLVAGALLTPGRRTVCAALRAMGLGQTRRWTAYHRVLNRAKWSSLAVSRVLLGLLVAAFAPPGRWSSASTRRSSAAGGPRSRPGASIATRCAPARTTS